MPRPISRSELARIAGVSPAMVTKHVKGQLQGARVGSKVDIDHHSVREWLAERDVDLTSYDRIGAKAASKPTEARPPKAGKAKASAQERTPSRLQPPAKTKRRVEREPAPPTDIAELSTDD